MNVARLRVVAASVVVLLVAAGLIGFAVRSEGYAVRSLDLNDSGVWVTNDRDGLFGRINRAAGALDAGFAPPGGARETGSPELDIRQDAGAVVAVDTDGAALYPVDVLRRVPLAEKKVAFPTGSLIDMRGGTIAVLDPKSGDLRATRYDTSVGPTRQLDLRDLAAPAKPRAKLAARPAAYKGDFAALAVTVGGAVLAADAAGKTVRLAAAEEGGFAEPVYGTTVPRAGVAVTAVGEHRVLADRATGTVQIDDGPPHTVATGEAITLQQPSPGAAGVLVATTTSLLRLGLADGLVTPLFTGGAGAPAAPVRLGDCAYGAWSGQPGVVAQGCGSGPATGQNLAGAADLREPVFRVNRANLVLNDRQRGEVYDVERKRVTADWMEAFPPPKVDPEAEEDAEGAGENEDTTPETSAATVGARPGRATVVHVLDHVKDLSGKVLAVTDVEEITGGVAIIAPDRQTVRFTLSAGARTGGFVYAVDAGGRSATGEIRVNAHDLDQNVPPGLRKQERERSWAVPAGGVLSIPVLADWRDGDGDAVVLSGATAGDETVRVTSEGHVELVAPAKAGRVDVSYRVTDGHDGGGKTGHVSVDVQAPNATTAKPATARPDAVSGSVNRPIVITPLANDLPGSDPTDETAHLALAGDVADGRHGKKTLRVETDVESGVLTASAEQAGTYYLSYQAAYGSAVPARGGIRVDVEAQRDDTVIAMPDSATLRGQAPALVDVLSNDLDPAGGVLTVQSAAEVTDSRLQVAVVGGRWLRITPTGAGRRLPAVVRYSVTSGVGDPQEGEVSITTLDAVTSDIPLTRPDAAVVRAGDTTLVPVLDNDSTVSGSPLTLKTDVPGAPAVGRLVVSDPVDPTVTDVGSAYVSGQGVRFIAPETVAAPRTLVVDYIAQTETGETAGSRLTVTVLPLPTDASPNQPPTPPSVEARVVQGSTVSVPVDTSGGDPDGDSVVVAGITSAPRLGRLLGFSPNSLTYQAYPEKQGSDSFTYAVLDRFGQRGEATVRISVVPAAAPQPPVPLPDIISAEPGATVTLSPLANDLYPRGDPVAIVSLRTNNPDLPAGVALARDRGGAGSSGPLTAVVPAAGEQAVVNYALTGNGGKSVVSTVTIRGVEGFRNPPRIADHVAKATAVGTTTVDVLANAVDPDGDSTQLSVSSVASSQARITGGKIRLPVTDAPQAVPYVVTDESGSSAAGVIYVPAAGSGGPFLKSTDPIAVAAGASASVRLADYIASPTDGTVTVADARFPAALSPAKALRVDGAKAGSDAVTVRAADGFTGPAALMLWVTDGAAAPDSTRPATLVSLPIQVGPDTPLLRCPPLAIEVVQGAEPTSLDISSLCHVWTSDPAAARSLTYDARWKGAPIDGVRIGGTGTGQITVEALTAGTRTSSGEVEVWVAGTDGRRAVVKVRVVGVPPPTISAITVDHVQAGETVRVDVAARMTSPLRNAKPTVVSVDRASGDLTASHRGSVVELTPSADAVGVLTATVTVSDDPAAPVNRRVTGTITMTIYGKPDAPRRVEAVLSQVARSVEVTFVPGSANGAPVDYYEVVGAGKTVRCGASPCTVPGLPVGQEVSFVVRAHNEAGFSDDSPASAAVMVDERPQPVTRFVAEAGDQSVLLTWQPAVSRGTDVTGYVITWVPGTAGGRSEAGPGATSLLAPDLENGTSYEFTITAGNAAGPSSEISTRATPFGAPTAPAIAALDVRDVGDGLNAVIDVTWSASVANATSVSYTVTQDDSIVCTTSSTSCSSDPVPYGTPVTFTVTAVNDMELTSVSERRSITPVGEPVPWDMGSFSSNATGNSREVTLTFTTPRTNGGTGTVKFNDVAIASAGPGGETVTTPPVDVGANGPVPIVVTICNEGERCTESSPYTVTHMEPLRRPSSASGRTAKLSTGPSTSPGVEWAARRR